MATKKSEEFELARIGATPVKNSGRGLRKGDGVLEPFLVDVKEYAKSFSLSKKIWAKLGSDAVQNGKRQPMLVLVLGEEEETPVRIWCVGERMGSEMLEAWKEKYEDD